MEGAAKSDMFEVSSDFWESASLGTLRAEADRWLVPLVEVLGRKTVVPLLRPKQCSLSGKGPDERARIMPSASVGSTQRGENKVLIIVIQKSPARIKRRGNISPMNPTLISSGGMRRCGPTATAEPF